MVVKALAFIRGQRVLRNVPQGVPLLWFLAAMQDASTDMLRFSCGLTFELSGERRRGALAARLMIDSTASRPGCHAGASPLERRVRPQSLGR